MIHHTNNSESAMQRFFRTALNQTKGGSRWLSTSSAAASDCVVFSELGDGVVSAQLNRPKALNALNLEMIRVMTPRVLEWNADKAVSVVVLEGAGEKAFCAGGDIVSLYKARDSDSAMAEGRSFFKEEYYLDNALAVMRPTQVAIMDGVNMGGGVGVSINARVRIATERTVFAMPETGIGLFPDVGGSYFLPRMEGGIGFYLALTGTRLKGADCVYAGVATHFVPSDRLPQLKEGLKSLGRSASPSDVEAMVAEFADKLPAPENTSKSPVVTERAIIDECFVPNSLGEDGGPEEVEDVLELLEKHKAAGSQFAETAISTIKRCSPTSTKVTWEQLKRGADLSLQECYHQEYRIASRCLTGKDFFEGVRALLIDKDNKPNWDPRVLEDVGKELVQAHFDPVSGAQDINLPSEL